MERFTQFRDRGACADPFSNSLNPLSITDDDALYRNGCLTLLPDSSSIAQLPSVDTTNLPLLRPSPVLHTRLHRLLPAFSMAPDHIAGKEGRSVVYPRRAQHLVG